MSWFDTAGIASFAKSALNTAQKTIDKALEIPEEKAKKEKTAKKADSDENFFEAFGLTDKPSTSQVPTKSSQTKNVDPSHKAKTFSQDSTAADVSRYFSDTWGSFFDIKAQSRRQSDSKSINVVEDSNQTSNVQEKENAVLAQPHRNSLFPGDSFPTHTTDENWYKKDEKKYPSIDKDNDNLQSFPESNPHNDGDNAKSEKACSSVVTAQPSLHKESVLSASECLLSSKVSDEQETFTKLEQGCDTVSQNDSITTESECKVQVMDQSDFFQVDLPVPLENTKNDSDSNFIQNKIDQNKTDISDSALLISSSVIPKADCSLEDNSSSMLIIPDLPVTVAKNVENWECCALESVSPDIFAEDECDNSNFLNQKKDKVLGDLDSPFHTINVDSFNNNLNWSENLKNKPNQSIAESPSPEQGSHHSDGSSNSSKDDDDSTDNAEVKEYDSKSTSSSGTSSSSFVKCSTEENDNSHRGQSPTSTIASERSDNTKQESEQTYSGDENETATSSDIEILSPPNGENGDRNSSPLKHVWLSRPIRFRRSESPTSDSSKDSIMPVVSELEEVSYEDENNTTLLFDEKDDSGCHKSYGGNEIGILLQKQDELQSVLDAREKKIVELSKENIELQENEQRLKNLMLKMRIEQAKESRDTTSLTREFTQRLALVEGQLKEALKDRNAFQQQLEEAQQEINKRILASDFEEVIKEKDQQIKELTEEGQKLAKKELTHTTIIKKLRAKDEEMTRTVKSQSEQLEDNSKEVERLRKSIGAKEDQEMKHIDVIRNLNNTVKKLEKEVDNLKSDLEDNLEKQHSFKNSLDSTYKEFMELQKSYALKEAEVEELKSNLDLKAKENLQKTLENVNKDSTRVKEELLSEMQQLRYTISRTQDEANSREKMFKDEIANLQKRLQEAEERNEDLTKNMSSTTRPLVRQIENLQATFTSQTISWEKIEKNLTDRLSDAQNQVAIVSEKERSVRERYLDYQSKVTALESQNSTLRQEKLQLSSEIESLKTELILVEENKNKEAFNIEKAKQNLNLEFTKLKQEKFNLENTMATCLEQLDAEKRKVKKLEEEIKIKDARLLFLSGSSPCPSPTGSVRSSISSMHNWSQDELHDQGTSTPVNNYRMSVYESLRLGSGSSLLENLQSQLKQREGEILQLQHEIAKLEQVKESMTRELVLLSEQNEELDKKVTDLEDIEKKFKELDQKYNTLLQMYGEKIEETEELQLDLADVKSMYKAQIEELLMKK